MVGMILCAAATNLTRGVCHHWHRRTCPTVKRTMTSAADMERVAQIQAGRAAMDGLITVRVAVATPDGELAVLPRFAPHIRDLTYYGCVMADADGNEFNAVPSQFPLVANCCNLQTLRIVVAVDLAPLAACTALTALNAHSARIGDLGPLADCPGLRSLDLSFNPEVHDVGPLAACVALTDLNLVHSTHLVDIAALANCTGLVSLNVSGTRVVDVSPVARLTALTDFVADHAPVADLAPLEHTRVETVQAMFTNITAVPPVSRCVTLLLTGCRRLTSVDALVFCTALHHLDIAGTRVAAVAPIASCTALVRLVLAQTPVVDLSPLARCTALERLDMGQTPVVDIGPLAFCTALRRLSLSETNVRDIAPLAHCPALAGTSIEELRTATFLGTIWDIEPSSDEMSGDEEDADEDADDPPEAADMGV